jgi:hypothetical protein
MLANEIILCVNYQLFNQLIDFYDIQWRSHAIEGDLDAVIFNPVASTFRKWRTFKLLWWMENMPQSTLNHETVSIDICRI